jgi:hypothetical protein
LEPEVGFEPTTFRLRVKCFASDWTEQDRNYLLTLGDASVQTALDGYRPIVWMIIGMIKGASDRQSDGKASSLGLQNGHSPCRSDSSRLLDRGSVIVGSGQSEGRCLDLRQLLTTADSAG